MNPKERWDEKVSAELRSRVMTAAEAELARVKRPRRSFALSAFASLVVVLAGGWIFWRSRAGSSVAPSPVDVARLDPELLLHQDLLLVLDDLERWESGGKV